MNIGWLNPSRSCSVILGLLTLAAGLSSNAADNAPPIISAGHALLVGCTRYDNLPESYTLQGPANDVLLMRDLLVGRFGFDGANVRILAEHVDQPDRRPTRANIEREFQRLREVVKPGDRVVVFMAGHGSQQPDQDPPDPADPEPDGLDEVFLPADVGAWDGGKLEVANSIRDDEIRAWLTAIRKKNAAVWAIFDACHSGTLCRGLGTEKLREVPTSLLVPQAALTAAEKLAEQRRERATATPGDGEESRIAPTQSDLVAIYASQSTEPTVEQLLPPHGKDAKPYGLLTYSINQVLTRADAPLTYNELIERVQAQYVHWGRSFPTPLVEGPDREREVLGSRQWPGRSRILLQSTADGWSVNAGALHGLTPDCILAVHPPAGQPRAAQPLGYVRVVECEIVTAVVEPCDHGDTRTDESRLVRGGICETVVVDFGDLRLQVAVDEADHLGKPVSPADRQRLTDLLTAATTRPQSLIKLVEGTARPDWLVRIHQGAIFLVPAAGLPTTGQTLELPPLYGPAPPGPELEKWLIDRLTRIARARNLVQLAGQAAEDAVAGESPALEIDQRLLRGRADRVGVPLVVDGARTQVFDGDRLALRVKNPNPYAVDVTLLYVDAGCGIAPLFPQSSEVNRLGPDEATASLRIRVSAESTGLESVVAIAVRAGSGQPVDFISLAQPSLELAQGVERTRGAGGEKSRLGQLLRHAVYGEGKTRSAQREVDAEYSIQIISWRLVPRPRAGTTGR